MVYQINYVYLHICMQDMCVFTHLSLFLSLFVAVICLSYLFHCLCLSFCLSQTHTLCLSVFLYLSLCPFLLIPLTYLFIYMCNNKSLYTYILYCLYNFVPVPFFICNFFLSVYLFHCLRLSFTNTHTVSHFVCRCSYRFSYFSFI